MKLKLSELRKMSVEVLVKSPIEITLSLLFFLLGIYTTWIDKVSFGDFLFNLKFYYFACFGLVYTVNQIFKKGKLRTFYYLSLLSPLFFYFYLKGSDFNIFSFIVTTFSAFLLMFVSRGLKENSKFVDSAVNRTVNFIFAAVLSGISIVALITIYMSVITIFGLGREDSRVLNLIVDCGMYIVLPLLFLLFEYNEKFEIRHNRFCEILFNYILTPTLLAYGVILYIYFAKIIFLWELPKGVVSTTAIVFLAGGLLVKACRLILVKRIMKRFFDFFSYIALPALGMLWVAIMYRIGEYGYTENRVYLLLTAITLTVWIFAQFFKRTNSYHYLTIFTISIFLLFTYAPSMNANAIGERNQSIGEEAEQKSDFIYLKSKQGTVDVEGYRYLVNQKMEYEKDSLSVIDRETDNLLLKISREELLEHLINGIANYKELETKKLSELNNKYQFIYRGDNVMIIFDGINLEKKKNDITIAFISDFDMKVFAKELPLK